MAKFRLLLTLILPTLMLVEGCGGGEQGNPAKDRDRTLIVHIPNDPAGMNPPITAGAQEDYMHQLLFDKMIALDFRSLELRPIITEGMPEISEDLKSYRFTLKRNVFFSDKHPMEAEDIVFSFKSIFNPFVSAAPVRAELVNFEDCIALDKSTVEFRLSTPGPRNLDKLAINFFVMPRHIYDPKNQSSAYSAAEGVKASKDEAAVSPASLAAMKAFAETFNSQDFQRNKGSVIGSGRYVFDEWVTGQYVRFVRNTNYWNENSGDPFAMQSMDTILFRVITDVQTALMALQTGEIDFSDQFKPAQISEKEKDPKFTQYIQIKTMPYPNYEYIGWNMNIRDQPNRSFFSDKRVRLALSHLVNTQDLIDNVMYGNEQARQLSSMVFHERPEYNQELTPFPYNEEKAKALLYEAGWEDLDRDGVLEKTINGQEVEFSFRMYYRAGNEVRKSVALTLRDKFKKFGILMEPVPLEWSVMLEKLKQHELDSWLMAWVFDSNEQDFFQLFHSSQASNEGYNWVGYQNPEADKLMEDIQAEYDQAKRYLLHKQVQKIMYDDQPYTLLFGNMARMVYNKRIDTDNWYGQRPCYDLPQFVVRDYQPE